MSGLKRVFKNVRLSQRNADLRARLIGEGKINPTEEDKKLAERKRVTGGSRSGVAKAVGGILAAKNLQ